MLCHVMQNTHKTTYFISGLCLPYECLLPFTLKQPMSGSLRAPSRSASTHSLSLFIAEYGQPNALQYATKTTVKFTPLRDVTKNVMAYNNDHTQFPFKWPYFCSYLQLGWVSQKKTFENNWFALLWAKFPSRCETNYIKT